MYDVDTFLTILYVTIDDFSKRQPAPAPSPGPAAALTRSEVMTLALFSQWRAFPSERAFYRYAERHLRPAFPTLPARSQFNRLLRRHHDAIVAFALALGQQVSHPSAGYEVLDSMGGCPCATPSAGGVAGSRDKPRWGGAIGSAGLWAANCS